MGYDSGLLGFGVQGKIENSTETRKQKFEWKLDIYIYVYCTPGGGSIYIYI